MMMQEARSYVPELTARTFWETDDFKWVEALRKEYNRIKEEFLRVSVNEERL